MAGTVRVFGPAWAVILVLLPIVGLAQDRSPATYAQVSAWMRDMRDPIMAGVIDGSFYNEHPSRAIRLMRSL